MSNYIRQLACIVSVVAGLPGCTGLRPALAPPQPIDQGQLKKLDGSYWNDTPQYSYGLVDVLLLGKLARPLHHNEPNLHLVLKAISERTVRVQVFNGSTLIKTAVRRGRVRKGYFLLRRRYQVTGFPGFIYSFISTRNRLALGTTDTLLLDTAKSSFAFMVVMPLGGGKIDGYRVPFVRRQR
jgi:hypothetical protein